MWKQVAGGLISQHVILLSQKRLVANKAMHNSRSLTMGSVQVHRIARSPWSFPRYTSRLSVGYFSEYINCIFWIDQTCLVTFRINIPVRSTACARTKCCDRIRFMHFISPRSFLLLFSTYSAHILLIFNHENENRNCSYIHVHITRATERDKELW